MYFDGEYRLIGSADPAPAQAAVAAMGEEAWRVETGRQQVYRAHAQTETVGLIFDPDMRHTDATIQPSFARFQPLLEPVMDIVRDFYACNPPPGATGPGYFQRIILVRLAAGGSIGSHRDNGASLSRAHRIHFPIVTAPGVDFAIAGVIRHLAAGEIWEINNRKPHAVRNQSGQARIHAILDYILPGEIVDDPDGRLVA